MGNLHKNQTEFKFNPDMDSTTTKNASAVKQTRQRKTKSLIDKFYTNKKCVKHITKVMLDLFPDVDFFVEPSAGCGNISHHLQKIAKRVVAYDLVPESPEIIQADYLKTVISSERHATIGNPPFGYKGNLAVTFLNKALLESTAVGFIMPITAKKYSLQNKILPGAHLLYQEDLPKNSFELPDKTVYECPAVFQIWSLDKHGTDIRKQKPRTTHVDFVLYRHNATKQSSRYVDLDWDFAVYAQGRKDYTKIFLPADKNVVKDKVINTNDQFYFFKASSKKVLKRLLSINFDVLAHRGHITPGFCKNDIIEEYDSLFGKKGN